MHKKRKKTTKELRLELVAFSKIAYERELQFELSKLQGKFAQWEVQKISSVELNEEIHRYHNDISRELWIKYRSSTFHDLIVARAIFEGIVSCEELSKKLLNLLEPKVNAFKT